VFQKTSHDALHRPLGIVSARVRNYEIFTQNTTTRTHAHYLSECSDPSFPLSLSLSFSLLK
jgi:hypothetical protein